MTDPTDQLPVIPIFPLTVVQFPGVVTPLHIFEERYRQLLRDIMPGDKRFGIVYPGDLTLPGSELPPVGRVGCTVEVIAQQELPDGRSNILLWVRLASARAATSRASRTTGPPSNTSTTS
jgi:Lon protease-like protein